MEYRCDCPASPAKERTELWFGFSQAVGWDQTMRVPAPLDGISRYRMVFAVLAAGGLVLGLFRRPSGVPPLTTLWVAFLRLWSMAVAMAFLQEAVDRFFFGQQWQGQCVISFLSQTPEVKEKPCLQEQP